MARGKPSPVIKSQLDSIFCLNGGLYDRNIIFATFCLPQGSPFSWRNCRTLRTFHPSDLISFSCRACCLPDQSINQSINQSNYQSTPAILYRSAVEPAVFLTNQSNHLTIPLIIQFCCSTCCPLDQSIIPPQRSCIVQLQSLLSSS